MADNTDTPTACAALVKWDNSMHGWTDECTLFPGTGYRSAFKLQSPKTGIVLEFEHSSTELSHYSEDPNEVLAWVYTCPPGAGREALSVTVYAA